MTPLVIAIGCGCLVGAGLWVVIAGLVPSRVDLSAALAAHSTRPTTAGLPQAADPAGSDRPLQAVQRRVEEALSRTRLTTPDADLSVVELSRGAFLWSRLSYATLGLLAAPLQVLIYSVGDAGIPIAFPAGVGLLAAAAGWLVPPRLIHGKAEARRREMRYALVAYLRAVAMNRAAGQGMAAALTIAARASKAWTFRRIAGRIDSARRSGIAPWDGLSEMAAELGIDELGDLASIADTAGTSGAGIYSILLARADALQHELQSHEEASASILTTRMVAPKALLGMATVAFLLYPAVTLIGAA